MKPVKLLLPFPHAGSSEISRTPLLMGRSFLNRCALVYNLFFVCFVPVLFDSLAAVLYIGVGERGLFSLWLFIEDICMKLHAFLALFCSSKHARFFVQSPKKGSPSGELAVVLLLWYEVILAACVWAELYTGMSFCESQTTKVLSWLYKFLSFLCLSLLAFSGQTPTLTAHVNAANWLMHLEPSFPLLLLLLGL